MVLQTRKLVHTFSLLYQTLQQRLTATAFAGDVTYTVKYHKQPTDITRGDFEALQPLPLIVVSLVREMSESEIDIQMIQFQLLKLVS